MSKPRILLIEDNPQNRILESFLLEEAGMEVLEAVNGREGLAKACAERPDLILLDIQLPDLDGYELLGQLKARPEVAAIPIVAVSSYAMAGERARALELGCAGYIEKPIDTANFARRVAEFLGGVRRALRVLVVEDRSESAIVLQENLEHQGYTVVHCRNGREVLQAVAEQPFDLVITDLLMPEMDGYQLTHALKSDPRYQHLPVLVYTATYTDEQDRALALELGAADFILKPAETEPFMGRVADLIGQAKRGELPQRPPAPPDETRYLRQYSERLMHKLEDKVLEAEQANRKLSQMNAELEQRVAQATTELRATVDKLHLTNRELESFGYTVAHDLRAPLRSVRGLVTILEDVHGPALPAEAQQLCQRLTHNADLMDRLIEDLLHYSRLGSGGFALAPLSLNVAVSHTLELLRASIQESRARVEVPPELPAVIGHEPTLIQVLSNLLTNALKFVAPGVRPEITLAAEEPAGRVRLHVRDNGIGIESEYQQRIFQVFERLHDLETYPGTGIGLAIVRKGVTAMGGTCGVESQPGRGSDFWIELPAARQAFGLRA